VTLFGAVASSGHGGWEQVTRTIHMAVSRFSNGTLLYFELMAAEVSGELAYAVGYERSAVSVNGGPVSRPSSGSPTSTAERTVTGNSCTTTAIHRPITARPPRRRRGGRHAQPDELMSTLTI
jgi:hypothetical protein